MDKKILTSYADKWYLFWYQWKEKTHRYTLAANIRVYDYLKKTQMGGCNSPPSLKASSEDMLQKMSQEDEG